MRTKEGIVNLHKHENALNHGVIDILAAPCMCSAIENGFMDSYSSPAHAGENGPRSKSPVLDPPVPRSCLVVAVLGPS